MERMLIVFASKTGTTEDVAVKLAQIAGREAVDLYDCRAKMLLPLEREGERVYCGEIAPDPYGAVALGTPDAGERAVDVQVTRLRRKIEPDPREPRFLQGIGRVLQVQDVLCPAPVCLFDELIVALRERDAERAGLERRTGLRDAAHQ